MSNVSLQLVVDAKASLGEGPCWDKDKQLLYWVDIMGESVHIYNPATGEDRSVPVGMYVGTVVKRESGGLAIAANQAFYALDPDTGALELLYAPDGEPTANRFNDGKCDPAGRFWAGTMPLSGPDRTGSLYRLDAELNGSPMLGGIGCSNGIAWNAARTKMYYIDTPTKQVAAFDYDLASGAIANRAVAIAFPDGEGYPDGMTIDAEGMLWIAHWGGYKVSRWNPETGERLGEIAVPAAQVTSCVFGGPDMDELYITTASIGISQEALEKQPHAGSLFKAKPGVKGTECFTFKG